MKTAGILWFLLLGAMVSQAQIFTDSRHTFSYTDDSTVMPGDIHVHHILYSFNGGCRYYPEYADSLGQIADYLLRHPNIEVLITIHSDTRGNNKMNQKMTDCRAERVAQYFKGRNVPENQYRVEGRGEDEPLISQETIDAERDEAISEKYHVTNRRTEVKIIAIK